MLWSFDRSSMSKRKQSENEQWNNRWDQKFFFFKKKNWLIKITNWNFQLKIKKLFSVVLRIRVCLLVASNFRHRVFFFLRVLRRISLIFIFIYIVRRITCVRIRARIRVRTRLVIHIRFVIVEAFMLVVFLEIKK